eukprot:m.9220 g.9220  ORF g.9220 m.9220 type:complete len:740 (+) comp9385_c0_seq3:519-2738(+)
MTLIDVTGIVPFPACNYHCLNPQCRFIFGANDPLTYATNRLLPTAPKTTKTIVTYDAVERYLYSQLHTPSTTIAAFLSALGTRPQVERKHEDQFRVAVDLYIYFKRGILGLLAIPTVWCGPCSGGVSLCGHPDARMGRVHSDLQVQPHFKRQGSKQQMTASDLPNFGKLITMEEASYDITNDPLVQDLGDAEPSLAVESGGSVPSCQDRQGIHLSACEHYTIMLVIDAESPERHAHYWQAATQLGDRFGCDVILADTACRMLAVEAKVNLARMKSGVEEGFAFAQSMLHGSFHPWYCLVLRGRPWLYDLGCATGEEAERVFGFTRYLKPSLQESSLVRRHKVLESMCWMRNQGKSRGMATFLAARAKRVLSNFDELVIEAKARSNEDIQMTEEELSQELRRLQKSADEIETHDRAQKGKTLQRYLTAFRTAFGSPATVVEDIALPSEVRKELHQSYKKACVCVDGESDVDYATLYTLVEDAQKVAQRRDWEHSVEAAYTDYMHKVTKFKRSTSSSHPKARKAMMASRDVLKTKIEGGMLEHHTLEDLLDGHFPWNTHPAFKMDRLKLLCRIRAHHIELLRIEEGYNRHVAHLSCKLDRCARLKSALPVLGQQAQVPSVDPIAHYINRVEAVLMKGLAEPCVNVDCRHPHLPFDGVPISRASIVQYFERLGSQRGRLAATSVAHVYSSITGGLSTQVDVVRRGWEDEHTIASGMSWDCKLDRSMADIKTMYSSVWRTAAV